MPHWHMGNYTRHGTHWYPAGKFERIFPFVAVALVLLFFLVGYLWRSNAKRPVAVKARGPAAVETQGRVAALDAVDEAMQARYEGRTADALDALQRARTADPRTPGLDVLLATISFEDQNAAMMLAASRKAEKDGAYIAEARLLMGLHRWMARAPETTASLDAASAAGSQLSEAIRTDFFFAPAWFFSGDISRHAGREADGYRYLEGALHRLNPWDSRGIVDLKMALAADEAGMPSPKGKSPQADAAMQAVVALRRALAGGADFREPATALGCSLTRKQVEWLAADPALGGESADWPAIAARGSFSAPPSTEAAPQAPTSPTP